MLIVANGQREKVVGEGTMTVHLVSGSTMKLYNVKHVPSANKYLLSVGKAYSDGFTIVMPGIFCHVEDSVGTEIACAENRFPYFWLVDLSLSKRNVHHVEGTKNIESCSAQVDQTNVNLWHRRFCHLGPHSLAKLRNNDMVTGLKLPKGDLSKMVGSEGICDACQLGRMTASPHKPTGSVVANRLELVHMDLMGPISPVTPEGERYALTIIDEHSNYSRVVLLKNKSEASKCAINVLKELHVATSYQVKTVRTDCGTEFNGLETFCRKEGISHQRTPPCSHESNGKVERLNRTPQEKVRPILADSNLPKKWWDEGILTANHVRNLSPVSGGNLTPHELLFGTKPSVEHLRVFGSKCFVFTPKTNRSGKFHSVSQKGTFLGYDSMGKGYRVLIGNLVKVVRGADVKVDEINSTLAAVKLLNLQNLCFLNK